VSFFAGPPLATYTGAAREHRGTGVARGRIELPALFGARDGDGRRRRPLRRPDEAGPARRIATAPLPGPSP
jgi:hypothetical protein